MDFSSIIKESSNVPAEDFIRKVEDATELLCGEDGRLGNFTVTDRLVKLDPVGEAVVIGDLHGDLESLSVILEKSNFQNRIEHNKDSVLIFLGDYGDRGPHSAEIFYVVLSLKLAYPKQVILLRGNHEGPTDLLASPHDLPLQLQERFKEKWVVAYAKLRELFACLYNAVYIQERYLMVHGGLPPKIRSLQEIAQADTLHPQKSYLEDLLWSDPEEAVQGTYPSPRGAGNLFSKAVTQEVLKKLNAQLLIRGHEPCPEGFKINHDGKILTLFSRKGSPYFNEQAAYLDMHLSEIVDRAEKLLPRITKF